MAEIKAVPLGKEKCLVLEQDFLTGTGNLPVLLKFYKISYRVFAACSFCYVTIFAKVRPLRLIINLDAVQIFVR